MWLLARKIWASPQPEIVTRVHDALVAMEMEEYAKRAPHMLSGGQKQRVAIAGVLAMLPEIIVFDEPTAMLDPSGRMEVMSAIRDLNQKHKKTVVLITHFMDEAVWSGHRLYHERRQGHQAGPTTGCFSGCKGPSKLRPFSSVCRAYALCASRKKGWIWVNALSRPKNWWNSYADCCRKHIVYPI